MTTITSTFILRLTTAFLENILSNPETRRHTISAARLNLTSPPDSSTLHAISLLSETLTPSLTAATSAAYSLAASANPSALSALLLSISFALRRRYVDAARALIDVFALDPASARGDIAADVFEELFLPQLFPVVRWFADRRSRILCSMEEGMGMGMALLSAMSEGQAKELRELESIYEGVMDENCRVFAGYLKEVLRSGEGIGVSLPELVLPMVGGGGEEMGLRDGGVNVMLLCLWL